MLFWLNYTGNLSIFKNGENVASSAGNQHPDDPYSAAAFTESEYSFVIGANPTDLSDTAGLALDDVKVWFHPLTDQDVKQVYEEYDVE